MTTSSRVVDEAKGGSQNTGDHAVQTGRRPGRVAHLLPRMAVCMGAAAGASAVVVAVAPVQGPVLLFKLAQVLCAGVAGYWMDRWVFPYARPDGYLTHEWNRHGSLWPDNEADFSIVEGYGAVFAAAMLRRALLMAGVVLAVGLGL